jgi:hypothetical protein
LVVDAERPHVCSFMKKEATFLDSLTRGREQFACCSERRPVAYKGDNCLERRSQGAQKELGSNFATLLQNSPKKFEPPAGISFFMNTY